MGGGKIECFLDLGNYAVHVAEADRGCMRRVASYFSYIAFIDLAQNRDKLAANGVTIDIQPVLLGGINHLSGNRPPWTNEVKARYLQYDSPRSASRVGLNNIQSPPDLMAVSHTISPLRALHYIKANYPEAVFLATFENFFMAFWTPPNINLIPEENLRAVLKGATEKAGQKDSKKLFTDEDIEKIMQGRASMKDTLMATTKRAVDQGAFGAPWIWATNSKGVSEPFFGSDRFHHVYKFLDIPFQDIAVLMPSKL